MDVSNCFTKLKEIYGYQLKDKEIKNKLDTIEAMIEKYPDPTEFRKRVTEYIEEDGIRIAKENLSELNSLIKNIELFKRVQEDSYKGDIKQGVISLIEESSTSGKYSGINVEAKIDDFKKKYIHAPLHKLKSEGLLPAIESQQFDKQIMKVMLTGTEDTSPSAKVVNSIAQMYRSVLDSVWADSVNLGTNLGRIENYLPVTHDKDLISAAGFDEWFKFIVERLDNKRTFKHIGKDAFVEVIEQLKAGRSLVFMDKNPLVKELMEDFKRFEKQAGKSSISDYSSLLDSVKENIRDSSRINATKSRQYHWKSPDAFIEYNDKFGRNKSFQEMMGGYLTKMTRELGVVSVLGPRPAEAMRSLISDLTKAGKLDSSNVEIVRRALEDSFAITTGTRYLASQDYTLAKIGRSARVLSSLSNLGLSAVTNLLDIPSTILNYWARTDQNVVKSVAMGSFNYIKAGKDVLTRNARASAYKALSDAIVDDFKNVFIDSSNLRGNDSLNRIMDVYLSTHGIRMMNRISTLANVYTAIDALSIENFKGVHKTDLLRFGLDESLVKLLNKEVFPRMNGDVDNILNMDNKLFENNSLGLGGLEYKNEVYNRFYSYVRSYATSGSPKPGTAESRILSFGQLPGTWQYEAAAALTQFKSVALKQYRNMLLASRLRGGGVGNNLSVFLAYSTIGTAFAGSTIALKELIKNGFDTDKTWEDIQDNPVGMFAKSFARSNGMAFLGEFFLNREGELPKNILQLAGNMLPPSVTGIGNVGLSSAWLAYEKGKDFRGLDSDVGDAYERLVNSLGRVTPLRNSVYRYIPQINEEIENAHQTILDLGDQLY